MVNSTLFPRFNRFFFILFAALFYGCSETDEGGVAPPVSPVEETVPFGISVFAGKSEKIYQVDILGNPEEKQVTDLSQTMGVPAEFREVHINGTKVTFFTGIGSWAFWQKDVVTGNILSRSPMCDSGEAELVRFAKTTGDQLAVITLVYLDSGEEENYLRVYNPSNNSCSRFYINDIYLHGRTQVHLHKERLYVYTPEEDQVQHSLTIIHSITGEQVKKFTFDSEYRVMMNEEQLFLLFPNGSYRTYRLADFSPLMEGTTGNPLLYNGSGIYRSTFSGSKMVFDYPYPQPGPLASAPAIYDWSTSRMTHGGDFYMYDVKRELEAENNQSLEYTTVRVNLNSNILVAGYKVHGNTENGGVIYFNFEGEMLMNIPLDYIPFDIMIRE